MFIYVHVTLLCVCHIYVGTQRGADQGTGSPEAGVAGVCEVPSVGAEN